MGLPGTSAIFTPPPSPSVGLSTLPPPSGEGVSLSAMTRRDRDLDALAAHLADDAGERRVVVQVDGERTEGARDRLARVVAHRADAALAEVFEDHALEQVVDVGLGERQIDPRVPLHLARAA